MSRPRIRWSEPLPRRVWVYLGLCGLGVALLTALAISLWVQIRQTADLRSFLLTTDFPPFLTGARLIAAGRGAQLYDPAAQSAVQAAILAPYGATRATLPYDHLPFLALALAPVAGLPLPVSYALWIGATTLVLLGALGLLAAEMRAVARDALERRWAPRALVALSLGFFPVYQDLLLGQTAPWDLLAYTLTLRYLRQERAVAAGLALTLALIKPQLLIVPLGVLLLARQWRTLAAFTGLSGALLLLVTPLLGGPGWLVGYGRLLADVATVRAGNSLIHPALMENLRGAFLLLAGESAAWALPATVLVSLAVLAWVTRAWWGAPPTWAANPAGWDARWAVALLATLLVNPHGLPYELTLWPLVGVLAWRAARADPSPGAVPRLVPWLVGGYLAGTLALPLLALIPGWPLHLGVLFMLAALVRLGRRSAVGSRRWGSYG
ncbi:MAG: glycosyltransferase 87 family protein [Chloroflexota bacterium]|nr:glycosyltransferase 87 family protein [Chloroflexota bacterium]